MIDLEALSLGDDLLDAMMSRTAAAWRSCGNARLVRIVAMLKDVSDASVEKLLAQQYKSGPYSKQFPIRTK